MPLGRPEHPKPPIEKALRYAEGLGRRVFAPHAPEEHDNQREYRFRLIADSVKELTPLRTAY